ncbi:hypothetical protein GMI69_00795 [Eggerthellaceae bacterium zg-887]|uniref:hypothetical protein n=1 Tax=Xiamenia xianingshaonis TaxID=2682776 RepID=UPI00140A8C2A|nr:hypothetical protein [Xiamenia xianingshaonis]NHM15214.1 hypothetical protein [Xiamenia xianingshaonis]
MIPIDASMKERLRTYYKKNDAPVDEAAKARVVAMVARETARPSAESRARSASSVRLEATPFWRFIAGQLRFVNPLAWAAQAALLAGMLLMASACGESESSLLVVMITAVLSVAIAMPPVLKSFENNVAELEASCCHNSAQVLVSRLVLFGLADVLWMSVAVCLVPTIVGGDPFNVFLYAATPFFAFCAICFYLARVTHGRGVKACMAAAICAVAAIWASGTLIPHWYADVSLAVWLLALLAALALSAVEAKRLVSQVTQGSTPHMAHPAVS